MDDKELYSVFLKNGYFVQTCYRVSKNEAVTKYHPIKILFFLQINSKTNYISMFNILLCTNIYTTGF